MGKDFQSIGCYIFPGQIIINKYLVPDSFFAIGFVAPLVCLTNKSHSKWFGVHAAGTSFIMQTPLYSTTTRPAAGSNAADRGSCFHPSLARSTEIMEESCVPRLLYVYHRGVCVTAYLRDDLLGLFRCPIHCPANEQKREILRYCSGPVFNDK